MLTRISDNIARIWATVFGLGYFPVGPGTAGAAGGLFILWLLDNSFPALFVSDHPVFWLSVFAIYFTGAWAAARMEKEWGEDPSRVVVDEWLGVWIAVSGLPFNWTAVISAFLLFRLLDIRKPLGIRRLERFGGGHGVMLDDLAAGFLANVILRLVWMIWL